MEESRRFPFWGAWVIFKKDVAAFFRSWAGILVLFSFLLVAGIFFTLFILGYSSLSLEAARQGYEGIEGLNLTRFVMGAFLLNLGALLLFLSPLISMRSLAEERKTGTLELLYTYPLSDLEILLGKYFALVAELALLFGPTVTYLGVIHALGEKVDFGVVGAGALGFFLLGATYLACGIFFSSLTENQILAAGLTFSLLVGFWVLDWVAGFLPLAWGNWLSALSPLVHFRDFSLGIIDLRDVTYFLGTVAFFLFLTLQRIEVRNWKG